jgi:hypothetical protein
MRYKEEVKITNGQQYRHHPLQRTAFASYQPLALYLRILRLTRTALSIPDNTPLHFLYGSASKGGESLKQSDSRSRRKKGAKTQPQGLREKTIWKRVST